MSIYEAKVFNTGGRAGEVHSEDNSFKMSVKQPKEMTGEDTNESNPEQLFAAAYSACYNSALDGVLKKDGADDVKRTVIATAQLLKDESDGGFRLGAEIEVEFEGVDQAKADEYVEQAHQGCPYSKMTRDGINVDLKATVK